MKLSRFYFNASRWAVAASVAVALAGCDNSFVFEDLDECRPDYRVALSFTRHLDGDKEKHDMVSHAMLYMFDENGNFVKEYTVAQQQLKQDNFSIKVPEAEKDKKYRFIFWGGVGDNPYFELSHQLADTKGGFSYDDLKCHLLAQSGQSNADLGNMFHASDYFTFTKMTGLDERTLSLTKDTNNFTISIENATDSKNYDVWIEDDNAVLDHENNRHSTSSVVKYNPITKSNADKLIVPDGNGGITEKTAKGIMATFSTSRLILDSGARIKIYNHLVKKIVLDKPLEDFVGDDSRFSKQEYLDRCDQYYMHVAVDKETEWGLIVVNVNGWETIIDNNFNLE